MQILDLVIFSFAVYYVATTVALTDGPLDIFIKFREAVGAELDAKGNQVPREGLSAARSSLVTLVTCPVCLSFWVAIVVVVIGSHDLISILAVAGVSTRLGAR